VAAEQEEVLVEADTGEAEQPSDDCTYGMFEVASRTDVAGPRPLGDSRGAERRSIDLAVGGRG